MESWWVLGARVCVSEEGREGGRVCVSEDVRRGEGRGGEEGRDLVWFGFASIVVGRFLLFFLFFFRRGKWGEWVR